MPELKSKCEINLKSAKVLRENNLHLSSIHCYYYACLQLSKHFLNHFCEIDYATQGQHIANSSHNYIVDNTASRILSDLGNRGYADYYSQMSDLKLKRKRADYSQDKIRTKHAQNAEDSSAIITNLFHTNYGITLTL